MSTVAEQSATLTASVRSLNVCVRRLWLSPLFMCCGPNSPTMVDDYSAIRPDDAEKEPSKSSGTMHVDLVESLDCTEMRPKVWYLSPGDAMSYHRQTEQEEFYYLLRGPGRMKIEGELHDVPEGTAMRIPPETRRQVLNDTEGEHVWLVVGAPPAIDDGRPADEE